MPSFKDINFSAGDDQALDIQPRLRGLSRLATTAERAIDLPTETLFLARQRHARASDETAGRFLLQTFLEDSGDESLRQVTAPTRPELVPDMQVESASPVPSLSANRVVFQQTFLNLPIFGARVAVDLDSADRSLVAINGKVTPLPDIDANASLSPRDALENLIAWSEADKAVAEEARKANQPSVLTWFLDQGTERWHLTYHFTSLPLPPRPEKPIAEDPFPGLAHVCLGDAPRAEIPLYDYFVDAHDGTVVFHFISAPHLDVPSPMRGVDELGESQEFSGLYGRNVFFLVDPIRNIETYDYQNKDINSRPMPPIPSTPISSATNDLANTFPAAVSAHYHAQVVFDFYNNVLKRDSVDDKGMKLISIVNVYSSNQNHLRPPQWNNAVWWHNKMWYGQKDGVSIAKHLDVIAHEMTHGVTATSCNLVYRDIPGALNESFSDVFGVIIANWFPAEPQPLATWSWEIGAGLGAGGHPLRDFSNPRRAGQPDHWSQYRPLPQYYDWGGVHIYSGIHNKAIHNLLTATDEKGEPTFPVREAALLLYLTLTRLTPTSGFSDSRRTLESVTRAYHVGDRAVMAARLNAIAAAFQAVGL